MNLNKEDVIRFIQEYEKHSVLWNSKDKWHFNKNRKNRAWDEIAKCINISVEDAKKKISSLLGSFRREKAKGWKTLAAGKGAKKVYKSDWFAFKSFAFLMDKDEPKETLSLEKINVCEKEKNVEYNETSLSSGTFDIESDFDCSKTPVTSCSTTELSNSLKITQEEAPKKFFKLATHRRKRSNLSENEKVAPRVQKGFDFSQQQMPKEDSTHTFGKYVAQKLNQFDATNKAILIHKINQLIFDAEMEKLSAETAVSYCETSLLPSSTKNTKYL